MHKKYHEGTQVTALKNSLRKLQEQHEQDRSAIGLAHTALDSMGKKLAEVRDKARAAELALEGVGELRNMLSVSKSEVDMLQRSVSAYAEQTHNLRAALKDAKDQTKRWRIAAMIAQGVLIVSLGYHTAILL